MGRGNSHERRKYPQVSVVGTAQHEFDKDRMRIVQKAIVAYRDGIEGLGLAKACDADPPKFFAGSANAGLFIPRPPTEKPASARKPARSSGRSIHATVVHAPYAAETSPLHEDIISRREYAVATSAPPAMPAKTDTSETPSLRLNLTLCAAASDVSTGPQSHALSERSGPRGSGGGGRPSSARASLDRGSSYRPLSARTARGRPLSARHMPACNDLAPVGWPAAPPVDCEGSACVVGAHGAMASLASAAAVRAARIMDEETHILACVLAKKRPLWVRSARPQGQKNTFPLRGSKVATADSIRRSLQRVVLVVLVATCCMCLRQVANTDSPPVDPMVPTDASLRRPRKDKGGVVVYFDENRLSHKVFGAPQNLVARARARALEEARTSEDGPHHLLELLPKEESLARVGGGDDNSLHAMIAAARAHRLAAGERCERPAQSGLIRRSGPVGIVARNIEEASASKAMRSSDQRARDAEYRQRAWMQSIDRYEKELARTQSAAATWERRRAVQEDIERALVDAAQFREKQAHWLCFVCLGTLFDVWSTRHQEKMHERLERIRRDLAARKIQKVARSRLLLERNQKKSAASLVIRKYYLMLRWKRNLQKKAKAAGIVRHILHEIAQLSGIKKTIASFRRKVICCQRQVRRWIAKRLAQLMIYELQFAKADGMRVERLRQNARKQVRNFEKDRAIAEELGKALLKDATPFAMMKEAESVLGKHKHLVAFKDEVISNIRVRDSDLRLLRKAGSYNEILMIVVPTMTLTPVRITHVAKAFAKRLLQEHIAATKVRVTKAQDDFVDQMSRYTLRTRQRAVFSSMLDEIKSNPNFSISLVPREFQDLLQEIEPPRRPLFPLVMEPDRLQTLLQEAVQKVNARLDQGESWKCDIGHYEFISAAA